MEFTRYSVTGAAGFVGAALVRRLGAMGVQVQALVRPGSNTWRLDGVPANVTITPVDLLDGAGLREALVAFKPDVVEHLAAHGAYPHQQGFERILMANTLGCHHVIEAARASGAKLFVQAGSSSEYGFKDRPMDESDRPDPNSHYAIAKLAATHLWQHTAPSSGMRGATLRIFSAYGPLEEPTRLVPTLIGRCLRNEPVDMASRTTVRDFVFVEDVVDAFLMTDRLMALTGDVINVGTGEQTTLEQLVSVVTELTHSTSDIRWGAYPPRAWDTNVWVASTEKSRRVLGWTPRTSLRDGIRKTIEALRA